MTARPAGPFCWSWETSAAQHPERRESGLQLYKTEATALPLTQRERLAPLLLLPILLLLGVGSLSVVIRTHSLPGKAYELPLPPPKPEIRFSLESGAYPEDAIQVTVTAPEPYRIAYTTDGHCPTPEDSCGANALELTLEKEKSGALLRQKGYFLAIVSNCQEGYIEAFLAYHGLEKYFDDTENFGHTGHGKGDNIRLVVNRNRLEQAAYLGDTQGDWEAAREAGIPFIHAAYGFGTVPAGTPAIRSIQELPALLDRKEAER